MKCDAKVYERPGYWHWHKCGRPHKGFRIDNNGQDHPVCGIHIRGKIVWHVGGTSSKKSVVKQAPKIPSKTRRL